MYAADACESGYAVVIANWTADLAARNGRISERSRFRMQKGGRSAREHAARSAHKDFGNVLLHPDTVWSSGEPQHCPDSWALSSDFPEIPRGLLLVSQLSVVCSRHFRFSEAMHMKEARAINRSARRTTERVHTHLSNILLLCDNMSLVLAFERRRAHVCTLLRQVDCFQC